MKLSPTQKDMLRLALDTGSMTSGRYGWNTAWVRALEKKGLVKLVSKATWDSTWRLTDAGRAEAQVALAEWKAGLP